MQNRLFSQLFLIFNLLFGFGLPVCIGQHQDPLTVFLLRGIGREAGHWGDTYPNFIKTHFPKAEVITMDLPGAGKYFDQPALPTVEKMADFLRNEYHYQLDSIPGKKVIIATSLAGNVALEWITQYPYDFHGAILLSTSLKGICPTKSRVKPAAKRQFVSIFLTTDVAEREKAFLSINSNLNVGNDSLLTAWQGIQKIRPVSQKALLRQTVAGMIYKPSKKERPTPLLLVGSKADKIVEESCFHKVADAIGSDLILHETAGHGIPVDVPEWLAETTYCWISDKVVPYDPGTNHEKIPTRSKNNGIIPARWLDTSVDKTGNAVTNSWKWMDDRVNWISKFTSVAKVESPEQKQQLKALKKQFKMERKQLKKATKG